MNLRRVLVFVFAALSVIELAVAGMKLVPAAQAASKGLQYKIVTYDERNREAVLNEMASQGWEFVAVEPKFGGFIFEKE